MDQLSISFDPFTFQWLPKFLPKNVKIIFSFVPSVFNLLKRFKVYLGDKVSNVEPLPSLGDVHSMDIVKARLTECDRTITANQSAILQELFSKCSLPLFSRVMLEEILTWKSYTSVSLEMVSSSLKEALNNFFRRLELHHGKVLVRHTLAYITAARDGISEMELLDLLSLDDEVLNSIFLFWLPPKRRIPPFLWTRLRLELGVFLVERDAGDIEVFSWYHRMFKEAASERYLDDEDTKMKIHKKISEYFLGTWNGKDKPFRYSTFLKSRLALTSDDGAENRNVPAHPLVLCRSKTRTFYNKRKLTELPFHLIKCGTKEELYTNCLFDYHWLWTKIKASGLQFVVEDFELALTVFDDNEVQALADTLRIAGCTLDDYPDNLALEITGRLLDLINTMPKIRGLLHKCDEQGIVHSSVVIPVQMYEAPISSLTRSIESAPADNGDNLLVRKDTRVVSICLNGSVQSWDTSKGTLVSEILLPKMKSESYHQFGLYPSRDERYIVCECRTGSQYIYTLETDSLRIVNEHKLSSHQPFHDITVSRNYVCMDNAVYEIHHGKKVRDLNSYRKVNSYVELGVTQCEKYLLIGDESLDMYKIYTGKRVKQLAITNSVSCIQLTSDGRLAIIGTTIDCAIKIFDVNDLSPTFGQEVVTYSPQTSFPDEIMSADSYASQEVSELCISNKEGAFVSLVKRKYPIVWSLKNVSTKPRLLKISKGPNPFRYLFQVQFSADDKFVLAAELSPNIMMWDSITGSLVAVFQAQNNDIHDLVVGKHSPVAVTAQQNGPVINVWDIQKVLTMEKMSSVKQQEYSVKNIAFSNQSNIIFLTRVQPPKSSKAYHYIDYFGVEIIDLASGKAGTLLPFDRYGHVLSIANSKDASVVVICTGNTQANSISVINIETGRLLKTLSVPGCKSVKLSCKGEYMCILTDEKAELYSVPAFEVVGKFNNCTSGMFTKTNAFVGIGPSQLLIQESMEDDETLTIDLVGDVIAIHYSEVIDLILITVDDGLQVDNFLLCLKYLN
jgi:WD40 repeat protein